MKRLHVHVMVKDLDESIRFYSTLFGSTPTVTESDYAKWMLDDPSVNFAISERCGVKPGLSHLGIQVDEDEELSELSGRLAEAGRPVVEQKSAQCCYAEGDKAWISDPQDIAWETFRTFGQITVYGEDRVKREELSADESTACCPQTTEV